MKRKNVKMSRSLALLLAGILTVTTVMPVMGAEVNEEVAIEISDEISVDDVELSEDVATEVVEEDSVIAEDAEAEIVDEDAAIAEDDVVVEDAAEVVDVVVADGAEGSQIEVNQGMSIRVPVTGNAGDQTYMNEFVAKKATAIMMKIPGSDEFNEEQAKNAIKNYVLKCKKVENGAETETDALSPANGDVMSVLQAYDRDGDVTKGWYAVVNFPEGPDAGTVNFHWNDGETELSKNEGVVFRDTQTLNILIAPVKAYWSKKCGDNAAPEDNCVKSVTELKYVSLDGQKDAKEWSELAADIKTYLLDVYPVADVNIEVGKEIDASEHAYDMVSEDGQKKLWEEACKLQAKDKNTGKDRYDLILAFVAYRQGESGGTQGFTFGKPTNIITYTDTDMFPTIAHEIAHCYQVGDEYDGGSFNMSVNQAPNGYKGRNFVSGEDMTTETTNADYWQSPKQYGEAKGKSGINQEAAGTMVSLDLHPYSLSQKKFITWADKNTPVISYMGSNYSSNYGYYWTSSVIWEHLFKELLVKEKKEEGPAQEDGATPSIFSDDDLFYDDDYRFGESRMIEVSGWLDKDPQSGAFSADINPMFSYQGDLEFLDVEDIPEASVYSFVAVDKKGNVIISPVDGKPAVALFDGNLYSAASNKTRDFVSLNFDAEYPEGTEEFVIVKGKVDGSFKKSGADIIWSSKANGVTFETKTKKSDDEYEYSTKQVGVDTSKNLEGMLLSVDNNREGDYIEVKWMVNYLDANNKVIKLDPAKTYAEVYYCPEGDDGEIYFIADSVEGYMDDIQVDGKSIEFKNGEVLIPTANNADGYGYTDKAYVWVKVTDGINGCDIFSDDDVAKTGFVKSKLYLNKGDFVTSGFVNTTAKAVTFKTSDNKVVAVDSKGNLKAKATGKATITATIGKKSYTCDVKVYNPTISKISAVAKGKSVKLEVLNGRGTTKWTSSDPKIATVDKNGKVKGKAIGKVVISAKNNGKTVKRTIQVVKTFNPKISGKSSVKVKKTITLKVKGGYGNTTWKSSNKKIATVDKNGKVKGISKGKVTITATNNGKTIKKTIVVK